MDLTTSALLLAWVAIAILAMAMAGLLRQVSELRQRGQRSISQVGPALHTPAPPLKGLEVSKAKILVFASEKCVTCETLLQDLETRPLTTPFEVVVVYANHGEATSAIRSVCGETEAFKEYGVTLTPYAVAIDDDGMIVAASLIGSLNAFKEFVEALIPKALSMTEVAS